MIRLGAGGPEFPDPLGDGPSLGSEIGTDERRCNPSVADRFIGHDEHVQIVGLDVAGARRIGNPQYLQSGVEDLASVAIVRPEDGAAALRGPVRRVPGHPSSVDLLRAVESDHEVVPIPLQHRPRQIEPRRPHVLRLVDHDHVEPIRVAEPESDVPSLPPACFEVRVLLAGDLAVSVLQQSVEPGCQRSWRPRSRRCSTSLPTARTTEPGCSRAGGCANSGKCSPKCFARWVRMRVLPLPATPRISR